MTAPNSHPCPACGFLTFAQPPGSFDICAVCGWEDDAVQLANPCTGGGANMESLCEKQEETLAEYPQEVEIANGFTRAKNWRPLSEDEITYHMSASANGTKWTFPAVSSTAECYWQQQPDA